MLAPKCQPIVSGAKDRTHIKAPQKTPAIPSPAIVRPTMNIEDLGAVAQTNDPISNMIRAITKTLFAGIAL